MATDLGRLEAMEYQLVDRRAACLRKGLRVGALDDALAGVRRAIASAISKSSILRKFGGAAPGWRSVDHDRDEHRRRLAKLSPGSELAKRSAAEDEAMVLLRSAMRAPIVGDRAFLGWLAGGR